MADNKAKPKITVENQTNPVTQEVKQKVKFPTEIIDLPSKGWFYPSDSPFAGGQVELRYMTAKEEDILTSQNLVKKGVVIDRLLTSLLEEPYKSAYNDLLIGDKNAIMIAARVLGYGKEYKVEINDGAGNKQEETIDLTSLDDKEIDFDNYEKGSSNFDLELPASKRHITFTLLTQGKELQIENELKGLKKMTKRTGIDVEMTTRLKHLITSIDGDEESASIRNFVDNEMLSLDSRALREAVQAVNPDVDMSVLFTSQESGEEMIVDIPITTEFFWPRAGK